jgi:hypothetical protein
VATDPSPLAARSGAVVAFPDTADRRLRRALTQLNRALDEQRAAVAAFRLQIAALGGAVGGLDTRAQSLRSALEIAAVETASAEARSRELLARVALMHGSAHR